MTYDEYKEWFLGRNIVLDEVHVVSAAEAAYDRIKAKAQLRISEAERLLAEWDAYEDEIDRELFKCSPDKQH